MVVCIDNEGYPVAPKKRKNYLALGGQQAEQRGRIRIIDEPGEDYLYRKRFFRSMVPQAVKKAVLAAA